MTLLNFGTSSHKNTFVKQKCLTTFIHTESFHKIIDKLMLSFYQEKNIDKIREICIEKQLFESFDPSHEKHVRYASWIGKWSEFFLETLLENEQQIDKKKWKFLTYKEGRDIQLLLQSEDLIERLLAESIKKTKVFFLKKCRAFRDDVGLQFVELAFDKKYPILNEDSDYFENVINHFKNNVFFNTKSFISRPLFLIQNKLKNNDLCEITAWEFDFYDQKSESIVELKFQQLTWSTMWAWQSLLYLYLVYFNYGIKGKGVKILNTLTGVQYQLKLEDFCGKKEIDYFYQICKINIMDQEKITFRDNVAYIFKAFQITNTIDEHKIDQIFVSFSSENKKKFLSFAKKYLTVKNKNLIKDPCWLGEKWISY